MYYPRALACVGSFATAGVQLAEGPCGNPYSPSGTASAGVESITPAVWYIHGDNTRVHGGVPVENMKANNRNTWWFTFDGAYTSNMFHMELWPPPKDGSPVPPTPSGTPTAELNVSIFFLSQVLGPQADEKVGLQCIISGPSASTAGMPWGETFSLLPAPPWVTPTKTGDAGVTCVTIQVPDVPTT